MRIVPRRWNAEVMAMVAVLVVAGAELLVLVLATPGQRPVISGVLLGSAAAVLVVFGEVWHVLRRRGRRGRLPRHPRPSGEAWFSAEALEGFPADGVRRWLVGPDALDPNRFYAAWMLAGHGRDVRWIVRHLDLPEEAVRLLVEAARECGGAGG
ncbi:hypothetical protein [Streptomyces sp. 769]|uniref:hypothetical protein n=1 Tax=Streptomyces sp. 769 TaxID=1262452 RepID=UPI00057C9D3A|nr:hypothetical protein [Streptomyces sp. 769]AJC61694.1 conserved exported protein of unknown function [Streptomyces sp. 769]